MRLDHLVTTIPDMVALAPHLLDLFSEDGSVDDPPIPRFVDLAQRLNSVMALTRPQSIEGDDATPPYRL